MVELFGKRIKFQFDDKELNYPDLEIEFEIEFGDKSTGNAGFVRLYNLAESTISKLKKDKKFILKAGYKDNVGVILPGIIEKQKTNWENVDKKTILIVGDNTKAWLNSTINKTWKPGKKASEIATHIARKTGLIIGDIDIENDIKYEKGKTFSTTCKKALQEIANDTNSKLHSSRGRIYLRPKNKSQQQAILVTPNTGLIASPEINRDEENDMTYTVNILMNYKIMTDSLLKIDSQTITGNYRVINGKYTAEGEEFSTQVEVEKV